MRTTPSAFLRCGAIAVVAVILQVSGLGSGRVLGAYVDLVPLVVAAVAIYAGSISGAAMGFATGLLLDYITKGRRVTEGTTVVTSGFESDGVESLFPRGIAIGRVTEVDPEEVEQFQRVHVKPLADIRGIDYVQVLTERGVSTQAGVPLQ